MKKFSLYICLITLGIFLVGCGNTEQLDAYYDGMMAFNGNVQIITDSIDMIDEDNENASNQIVAQLEKLEEQFKLMSELDVPAKFSGCDELADDAYTYIQEATRLYKEWAEDPANKDEQLVSMANENYNRAMKRVNYIALILQGQTPEGEGITSTEEDITDFTPVMDDNSDIEDTEDIEYTE